MNEQEREKIVDEVREEIWLKIRFTAMGLTLFFIIFLGMYHTYKLILSTSYDDGHFDGWLKGTNEGYNQCVSDMIAPSKKAPKG